MKTKHIQNIVAGIIIALFTFISTDSAGTSSVVLFKPYITHSAGLPHAVGIGDFNNDGRSDAAVTNNAGELKIYLQNELGSLDSAVTYTAGSRPESLAVGDLNNDGRDDIVATNFNSNTISVFLQEEGGTMAARTTLATGTGPDAVAVGDVNGDGLDDVVVSNWNSAFISVFIQNNSGALNPKVDYISPQAGYDDIAIGDVNGDGLNDIVKMNGQLYANPNLSVYIQSNNGTLNNPDSHSLPDTQLGAGIGLGDVTGDGRTDVVMSYGGNQPNAFIAVFAQGENGILQPPVSYPAYDIPQAVEVADVNSDGLQDVIVVHGGWNKVSVYLQQNNAALGGYTLHALPNNSASRYKPQAVAVGDVNADALPDILVANYNFGLNIFHHREAPSAFNKTSPSNGATDQPLGVLLNWESSTNATGYEYCYDNTNDNTCSSWVPNGASTSKTLSGLTYGTTYYWTVRSTNDIGTVYSNGSETAHWSFTVTIPSNYVINTNDSGPGSLRQAITNTTDGDTITFAPYLAGGTIHLASELEVDKSITIDGSNLDPRITLSGDTDEDEVGDVQIMSIGFDDAVKIFNVDFMNGKNENPLLPGGIHNFGGSLEVENCTFSGNTGDAGGAILNKGNLTVQNCIFNNNTATEGGAILNDIGAVATIAESQFIQNTAQGGSASAGAIGNLGNLTITGSEFIENFATFGGGAIVNGLGITGGSLVSDSTFTSNSTDGRGGAIYIAEGDFTISDSIFNLNSAALEGGAIIIGHPDSLDNMPTASINNTLISNNHADESGGGILLFAGEATITNSTISGNTATEVAGIFVLPYGIAEIRNGTINGNINEGTGEYMSYVGAVVTFGELNVTNSTIANNLGSGIKSYGTTAIHYSTIAGNDSIGIEVLGGGNTLNLTNSIIANNALDCIRMSEEDVIENINNLIETTGEGEQSCGTALITDDPNLGPLADNGGPTQTMALLPGSAAINAGTNTGCPATDQRGVTRPQGSQCDIGAFELEPTFGDVPLDHPYFADIEILYANGLTAGCATSPLRFCPATIMNRAESAVFMLKGNFGNSYTPPSAPWGTFKDSWAPGTWAEKWAEGMYDEGLTAGCATNPLRFCPWDQTNREQAAVFGLKLKYGNAYLPPPATGTVFADMTDASYWSTRWTEQAYADGLLPSCGIGAGGKPNFCPTGLVSRGLAAYMIVRAKNLSMP